MFQSRQAGSGNRRPRPRQPHRQRLWFELLEDRRLLAAVTVNTILDTVDSNDGLTSLREAIFATNIVPGADEIVFDFDHDGPATILLTQGELPIADELTIIGPGADLLAIDGSGNDPTPDQNNGDGSRIFRIDDGNTLVDSPVTIHALTLIGGDVNGNGGAILANESLTVTSSMISGNSAYGGSGGGIRASGNVTVTASTISGNSAVIFGVVFYQVISGGIYAFGNVTVTSSTISENSAFGIDGLVGGIFAAGNVTVTSSTISGNSRGGIRAYGDVTITSSTISGNSAGSGDGGIRVYGDVTITSSTISGNGGGGIRASGNVTVTSSTISGNGGGGIWAYGNVTVTSSTISGNSRGINASGDVTVTSSTISENSSVKYGGAIRAGGDVTITSSTISENSSDKYGGAIHAGGNVTVTSSTISGNSGGGIRASGNVTVTSSTISGNSTGFGGGGIYAINGPVTITNSIVAGNWRTSLAPPVADDLAGNGVFTLGYSIVGAAVGAINTIPGTINYFGVDPRLGPLAYNGGPTFLDGSQMLTHALLPGSPALDAGDPAAVAGVGNVPLYDQRDNPFTRVYDGDGAGGAQIDIGAFELQPIPPAVFGDYNQNGEVDAADYVVWRNTLGSSVAAYDGADGDGNGTIDQDDYGVWRAHFGQSVPSAGAGSGFAEASSVESQELRAEALSMLRIAADHVGEPVQLPTLPTSAPTDTEAATARAASFALLETRSLWQDLSSPSRGRLHRYSLAESGADDLSLLLAIDRVWLSRRRDPFVSDDSVNDEHRVNDDHSRSLIDQPLAARCRPTHVRLRR